MKNRYLVTGVLLAAVLAAVVLAVKKSHSSRTAPSIPRANAASPSRFRSKGPEDARVQIIEYSDFQCPACRNAQAQIQKILDDFPGQIYFTFRHFPLAGHPWSMIAHQAAECANRGGKFWEYHDRLYREQAVWSASTTSPSEFFLKYARDLDLNLDTFAACMTDQALTVKILEERAEGERFQVKSTPTFFVNGERIVGGVELAAKAHDMIRQIVGPAPSRGNKT